MPYSRLGAPRAESLPRRRRVYRVRHEVTDTDTAAAICSCDVLCSGQPATIALLESGALWCRASADIRKAVAAAPSEKGESANDLW